MAKTTHITKEKAKRGMSQEDTNASARIIRARLSKAGEGFKEPPEISSGDPERRRKKKTHKQKARKARKTIRLC